MATRVIIIGIVLLWILSMSWLVAHDVVPAWTARQVPKFVAVDLLKEETLYSQARIENKYGHRLGTVWSQHRRTTVGLTRMDVIWLDKFPMAPVLRIEINSDFTKEGDLDTFELRVYGAGEKVELVGERFSGHLAFELKAGTRKIHRLKVDAASVGTVADVFRPFPNLPAVEVGQSWRMHVVNPLAAVTGIGTKLIPMLVKVTHKESIVTDDGPVECFVLDTGQARAWVDDEGVVLRQEMNLPIGGQLSIVAEKFNQQELDEALSVELDSGG